MNYQQVEVDIDFALMHANHPKRYPFFLESVVAGTAQARYDILFAFPQSTLQLNHQHCVLLDNDVMPSAFLDAFQQLWHREQRADISPFPFTGGWFLYLGYEFAQEIEPCLNLPANAHPTPIAFASRIPAACIYDHQEQKTWLIVEDGCSDLMDRMLRDCRNIRQRPARPLEVTPLEEDPPEQFLTGVDAIKRYIYAGDVFQVNLSRQWRGALRGRTQPIDVYQALKRSNPAPFAGFAKFGAFSICSSSPERLVAVRDQCVFTRPIAGTRPRAHHPIEDQRLADSLLAHPKERAEHVMLIDLERNDMGRICEPGSVQVDEFMVLESYAHVHHIVSNITGTLRDAVGPSDVVRATFPGGTITGCPKVRCMQIISELESAWRGAYTGAMGYVNHDGGMDMNILIRTIQCFGDEVSFRAGAGIVADSDPHKELAETRAKAQGMLQCLT